MIRRVFLTFLVIGVTACGDDGTGLENIAGAYTLQTVGGEELPVVLEESVTFLREITAGSLTLNQDASCSGVSVFRETVFSETELDMVTTNTVTEACTYTFNNGALALTIEFRVPFNGSITGSTLTLNSDGVVFIYEK